MGGDIILLMCILAVIGSFIIAEKTKTVGNPLVVIGIFIVVFSIILFLVDICKPIPVDYDTAVVEIEEYINKEDFSKEKLDMEQIYEIDKIFKKYSSNKQTQYQIRREIKESTVIILLRVLGSKEGEYLLKTPLKGEVPEKLETYTNYSFSN